MSCIENISDNQLLPSEYPHYITSMNHSRKGVICKMTNGLQGNIKLQTKLQGDCSGMWTLNSAETDEEGVPLETYSLFSLPTKTLYYQWVNGCAEEVDKNRTDFLLDTPTLDAGTIMNEYFVQINRDAILIIKNSIY